MSDVWKYVELYRRLGFSVIPIRRGGKEPLTAWSEYQRRKPSDGELRSWFGKANVNIGIVCGAVSGNLAVLDFDDREVYQRFFKERVVEKTLVAETSRGVHVYLRSAKPVESFKIPKLGLDVKGEGSYVVAPPSLHPSGAVYRFNGEPWSIKEIPVFKDLEKFVWTRANGLGVFRYGGEQDPPCVRRLLEGVEEGMRNEAAMRLVSYWLQFRRLDPGDALNRLRIWNLRNRPPLGDKELRSCLTSVLKHGYEYGCSAMRMLGVCSDSLEKTCSLRGRLEVKRKPVKYTASAVLEDGRIIEEAYRDGKVFYLVYNPKSGTVSEAETAEDGDFIYKPIVNPDVETGQVLLPSAVEEYGDDRELFNEVEEFLDYWHEQPDRWERKLDVLYVFQTWVYQAYPQVAYRRALGRYGTGKTAWLETVGCVCYRPIRLAGCDSEASLRRTFDLWRGTALIDEADFGNSTLYANVIKVLNIGYSRDTGWYRCCDENDPRRILSFNVYGPKLLATRTRFKDPALESRCLTFIAMKGSGRAPLFRAERFNQEAQRLRNKLLLWRFRNLRRVAENVKRLEEQSVFKKEFTENVELRVGQILLPLTALFEDGELAEKLRSMAEAKTEELKSLDPDSWLDEELPRVLKELSGKQEPKRLPTPLMVTSPASLTSNIGGGYSGVWLDDVVTQLYGDLEPGEKKAVSRKVSAFLRDRYGALSKRMWDDEEGRRRTRILIPSSILQITPLTKVDVTDVADVTMPGKAGKEAERRDRVMYLTGNQASSKEPDAGGEDERASKQNKKTTGKGCRVVGDALPGGVCEFCGRSEASHVVEVENYGKRYICPSCLRDLREVGR